MNGTPRRHVNVRSWSLLAGGLLQGWFLRAFGLVGLGGVGQGVQQVLSQIKLGSGLTGVELVRTGGATRFGVRADEQAAAGAHRAVGGGGEVETVAAQVQVAVVVLVDQAAELQPGGVLGGGQLQPAGAGGVVENELAVAALVAKRAL